MHIGMHQNTYNGCVRTFSRIQGSICRINPAKIAPCEFDPSRLASTYPLTPLNTQPARIEMFTDANGEATRVSNQINIQYAPFTNAAGFQKDAPVGASNMRLCDHGNFIFLSCCAIQT